MLLLLVLLLVVVLALALLLLLMMELLRQLLPRVGASKKFELKKKQESSENNAPIGTSVGTLFFIL